MSQKSSLVKRNKRGGQEDQDRSEARSISDSKNNHNDFDGDESDSHESVNANRGASISEALQVILSSRRSQNTPAAEEKQPLEDEFSQEPPATVFQLMGQPEYSKVKRLCIFMTFVMASLPLTTFFAVKKAMRGDANALLYAGGAAAVVVNFILITFSIYVLKCDKDVILDDNDPRLHDEESISSSAEGGSDGDKRTQAERNASKKQKSRKEK